MALGHILAVLSEMFSVTPTMLHGKIREDPLYGLHVKLQVRILWIFTFGYI
jgi:hypothetical protein